MLTVPKIVSIQIDETKVRYLRELEQLWIDTAYGQCDEIALPMPSWAIEQLAHALDVLSREINKPYDKPWEEDNEEKEI